MEQTNIQAIKEWGIQQNRKAREYKKECIANIEYSKALRSIGVEIVTPLNHIKHTRYMKIESYLNYRGVLQYIPMYYNDN